MWPIKNAQLPPGQVTESEWFGLPQALRRRPSPFCTRSTCPTVARRPSPFWRTRPWAGPAAYLFDPRKALGKLGFSRSDGFDFRGEAFLCQFCTYVPLNTNGEMHLKNGLQVVRVNFEAGTHEPRLRNKHGGPASATPSSGGMGRPVNCEFHSDGRSS